MYWEFRTGKGETLNIFDLPFELIKVEVEERDVERKCLRVHSSFNLFSVHTSSHPYLFDSRVNVTVTLVNEGLIDHHREY